MNQRSRYSVLVVAEADVRLTTSANSSTAVCGEQGLVVDHECSRYPAQVVLESRSGRNRQSSGNPARQGARGMWRESEVDHLKRLVEAHTVANRVNWVDLMLEWQSLSLPSRTKAALAAKYRAIMRNLPNVGEQGCENLSINGEQVIPTTQNTDCGNPHYGLEPDDLLNREVSSLFAKHLRHFTNGRKRPVKIPARKGSALTQKVLSAIDSAMQREIDAGPSLTWKRLTDVVVVAAVTATELRKENERLRARKSRNWIEAIKGKIGSLRATMGKITAELGRRKSNMKPTARQIHNIRMLKKEYRATTTDELTSLIHQLGDRLQLAKSRLELYVKDAKRLRLRKHFSLKTLDRETEVVDPEMAGPNGGDVRAFWKGIVGYSKPFDRSNVELLKWADSIKQRVEAHVSSFEERVGMSQTELPWANFESCLKKMKPWKAPGPDGLHAYWWKVFPSAGRALYGLMSACILNGSELPSWLTRGRVVLIYKSGNRDDPANYRPIACLNTSYKLITSMLASLLREHSEKLHVLPPEQVAIRRGTWGCTHAMLLDQAVVADATNQKQRPLHIAWIDYAKAFDSVPHAYIKWLLASIGVPELMLKFISGLMGKWSVQYETRSPQGKTSASAPLSVKSGVLQGDSFSPFLFCLSMAPLSHAITELGLGYVSSAGGRSEVAKFHLSHLFYMDDLKVYSSSAENLDAVLNTVERVSAAISMLVNAKKCARFSHDPSRSSGDVGERNGPENNSEEGVTPNIRALELGETYKYLGIEQRLGIKPSDAWKRAKEKMLGALERVWKLDLTYGQKVRATNSLTAIMSYVTRNSFYSSGTFKSTLARGDKLDVNIRGMLARNDARYKSNATSRLYLPTSMGGCGLNSIRDAVAESAIYAWSYINTVPELAKQLALFQSLARRTKRSIISDGESILQDTGCSWRIGAGLVFIEGKEYSTPRELARAIVHSMREKRNIERHATWKGLAVAGKVLRTPSLNLELSFMWIKKGQLNAVAARNVLAAQEACLLTRTHQSNNGSQSTCRKCSAPWETPQHILTNCTRWLSNLYIARHDSVVRCIHYLCCRKAELAAPHYTQSIPTVLINERFKLYSNHPIQTRAIIRHNKPDIVMYDSTTKVVYIVEVAVSWYTGLKLQWEIKHSRYAVNGNHNNDLVLPYPRGENLVKELSTGGWDVRFAVVIMGACGEACDNILEELEKVGIVGEDAIECIERMSRSAVLGSNRIIKQHLV